jgi:hypothetical protein
MREAGRAAASPLKRKAEKLKASRAASPRRNEGVTGNENPGCLSSSSSEIEYEDDDEDEPARQLEVMDESLSRSTCFIIPARL